MTKQANKSEKKSSKPELPKKIALPDGYPMRVAELVVSVRESMGLSKRELAEKLGVSELRLFRYETGEYEADIGLGFINRLAEVSKTRPDELVSRLFPQQRVVSDGSRLLEAIGRADAGVRTTIENLLYSTVSVEKTLNQSLHLLAAYLRLSEQARLHCDIQVHSTLLTEQKSKMSSLEKKKIVERLKSFMNDLDEELGLNRS